MTALSPQIIIITGLSGSGKTSAVKAFEDLGYFCVDNLPIQLIPTFVELCHRSAETLQRAVIVVDIREREFLPEFPRIYRELKEKGTSLKIVFFEAGTDVLMRRFSETRRPHPLAGNDASLERAISCEREALAEIRALADLIVDTSSHTVHSLRRTLLDQFSEIGHPLEMIVTLISFGFKHGVPAGIDLLFDVRFLPNPHFVPELRALTGRDGPVVEYLNASDETKETITHIERLLAFLLPRYQRDGRAYVTIGIGCTGGRHRSVMVVEEIGRSLSRQDYKVRVLHRDVDKL